MDIKPSVILKNALTNLGPNGEQWIQGRFRLSGYKKCDAVGAVINAMDGGNFWAGRHAFTLLERAMGMLAVDYNDSHTFEELKATFQKAAAAAEAEELAAPTVP
jgi:hypothetical protein